MIIFFIFEFFHWNYSALESFGVLVGKLVTFQPLKANALVYAYKTFATIAKTRGK